MLHSAVEETSAAVSSMIAFDDGLPLSDDGVGVGGGGDGGANGGRAGGGGCREYEAMATSGVDSTVTPSAAEASPAVPILEESESCTAAVVRVRHRVMVRTRARARARAGAEASVKASLV